MALALQSGDYLVGLLCHLFVDVLALFVVFVDVCGHAQGYRKLPFHQQVYTLPAIFHASRGIDARSYLEHDVTHRDFPAVEAADVNDGFQSDTRILVELFQSVECKNAVLVHHRHDVGGNGHGAKVE